MKLLYMIILFMTIFYGMIFVVNAMGVFPETVFLDSETGITNDTPQGIISHIFVPMLTPWGLTEATATALTVFIVVGALASGILVKSPVLPAVAIVGYLFFNMMINSYKFMSKLFSIGNSQSLIYLGVCIGAALIVIGLITVVEMVAQGQSGGD